MAFNLFLLLLLLQGCRWHPCTPEYHEQYAYTFTPRGLATFNETDYFIVFLVDAPHLDYSNGQSLLKTIAKHPNSGSKQGDVGHAWIYVQGYQNGYLVNLEGGHSGELGIVQPKYFDGIMNYVECGDPNPIRYLWEPMRDGFFQQGSGIHTPTFAAKVDLTETQFKKILEYTHNYPFESYSLTGKQCSTFLVEVAALTGLILEHQITIPIPSSIVVGKECINLWRDPKYAEITISTPDRIEQSLILAVNENKAQSALSWYLQKKGCSVKRKVSEWVNTVQAFPERYLRFHALP